MENKFKNPVTLKLLVITALMLLLLIPAAMIQSIIQERESLNQKAVKEVSQKWAGSQEIMGPVLTVPLLFEEMQNGKLKRYRKNWTILPEELNISGNVTSNKLKRGMYDVAVYNSKLAFEGFFQLPKDLDTTNLQQIEWNKAFITLSTSDMRGINEKVNFQLNGKNYADEPGSHLSGVKSGITIKIPTLAALKDQKIPFRYDLNLRGSEKLSFVPIGSLTTVKLTSNWRAPSFTGNFLPAQRDVQDDGFTANWKVYKLNRGFPQDWVDLHPWKSISESSFGVNLLFSLDDYQKSMRSTKYAVLTIALSFLIFFIFEVTFGQRIHPFQYAMVGLALCLFYILLISISEHLNFNLAYLISMLTVVTMVALYSLSVLKTRKSTLVLMAALTGIYTFIFVIIQLSDFALLAGSIGLTAILSMTMYFTRNINWYRLEPQQE